MKLWIILGLVVIFVFAGGIYLARDVADSTPVTTESELPPLVPPELPQPAVEVVGGEQFDFGRAEPSSKGSHAFVIKNVGQGDLVLKEGKTTCKCTISALKNRNIPPGGSTEVVIDWQLEKEDPHFRQMAPIFTNVRAKPRIDLMVTGQVTQLVTARPEELTLPTFESSHDGTGEFTLYSAIVEKFKITGHTFADKGTARFFDVRFQPETIKGLEAVAGKGGYRVTVLVKPGLPLGRFQQTIRFKTDIPNAPEVEMPVAGNVSGPISIAGGDGGWDPETGVLSLGTINPNIGVKREMRMFIRGKHQDVSIKNLKLSPSDVLKVTVKELEPTRNGKAKMLPFTIEIPKGSRTANCLGTKDSPMAQIVFLTDHPETPEIRVVVQFAIRVD